MGKKYVTPSTRMVNASVDGAMMRGSYGFVGNSPDPDAEYRGRTDWDAKGRNW